MLVVGSLSAGPLGAALRLQGHRTVDARNANEAVSAVVRTAFTAAFIPLDVDGLETRELVARLRIGRPGLAIVLSARPHEAGRIVSAWVHGLDAYVVDPPDDLHLSETMERVIETAHARMASPSDAPLAMQLEETKRALDEERQRVSKLRARVKKLEGSISGLSSELHHVVRTRTQPAMPVVASPPDEGKTNIYDDEAPRVHSAAPARATGEPRGREPVENRISVSDLNRSRIYDDDEWSESSTAAAPMHMTLKDGEPSDPAFRAPVVVDPFLDDEHDATDPVDVSVKQKGNAMKIGEFRDELSGLLRAPARKPSPSKNEGAPARPRARSAVTDPGSKSGSASGRTPRPRR